MLNTKWMDPSRARWRREERQAVRDARNCSFCMDPASRAFRLAARVSAGVLLLGAVLGIWAGWAHEERAYLFASLACLAASGAMLWASLRIQPNPSRCCEALERAAFVDPLTGQRNLTRFIIDAQNLLETADQPRFSMAYVDIKHFKLVNEIFGHEMGDELIRYWADYIAASSQPGEVFGRVGTDAFAILGTRYYDEQRLALRYQKAQQHLANFAPLAARGYTVNMYGGIYRADGTDGTLSVAEMLDRAAIAQEAAKADGSHQLGIFNDAMREQWRFEAWIAAHLDAALDAGEIAFCLQPKVDIQAGRGIVGMEALARWTVAGHTLAPSQFIPVLEKSGTIYKLDRHIFQGACLFYQASGLADCEAPPVLSVNVSRTGVLQPDFVSAYRDIKRRCGIPDQCVELEFTESVAMDDREQLAQIVEQCHEAGFLCSMDDFGAGYSSLNALKSIHVDVLKMDAEFFRYGKDAERGQSMVAHIITMAREMGMKTVAEGVETQDEVERLRVLGCDAVQGYVFAKPVPEHEFLRLFQRLLRTA